MYINYTRDVKPVVHVMKDSLGGLNYDKLSLIIWKWREKKCSAIVTPCCTLIWWYPSEHVGTIISLRKLVKLQSVERWFCFICFIIRSKSATLSYRWKTFVAWRDYTYLTLFGFVLRNTKSRHHVFLRLFNLFLQHTAPYSASSFTILKVTIMYFLRLFNLFLQHIVPYLASSYTILIVVTGLFEIVESVAPNCSAFHTFAPCLLKNHHTVFNYNIIFRLLTDAAKVIWFASLRHLQHGWWRGSLW